MIEDQLYKFTDKVLVRSPFYSFQDYDTRKLEDILKRKDFRNALWLASVEFYHRLEKKNFDYQLLDEKEKHTIKKYYNRMSFRPTPFGSFAAFTLASWTPDPQLRLEKEGNSLLHLLPSLSYLESNNPSEIIQVQPLLCTNPTLYRLANEWRYTQSVPTDSGKIEFMLAAIASNTVNDFLVGDAALLPVRLADLEAALSRFTGCTVMEATDYIAFLIQKQALISSASPTLIEKPAAREIAGTLNGTVQRATVQVNAEINMSAFTALGQPFYAGLERPAIQGGIDLNWQQQLLDVVTLLRRLVPHFENRTQQDFIKAFKAKFESQTVPLLKALDPDAGISYGHLHRDTSDRGLLENVRYPEQKMTRDEINWSAVHRLFLKIWLGNSKRSPSDAVIITDEDVNGLEATKSPVTIPPTMALLFTPIKDLLVVDAASGATATSLAGRFSVFSPEIHSLCMELASAEAKANPEVVFVEIHQRSHQHVDNINRRCRVYDHILPINVFPDPDQQGTLFPSDLLVSVQGQAILLESASLGKRVIPRLPTAYNYHHNELPLFRFLCDLQFNEIHADLTFNPERLFPGMDHYPRIVYKNCILSVARWHLRKPDITRLSEKPMSLGRLHLFRQEKGIPRHVSLGLSDQQLTFDLANDEEALFFLGCLKEEKSSAVIREYLFAGTGVTSEKKPMAAQVMAFLGQEQAVYKPLSRKGERKSDVQRSYLPGSEWLYVKLYCTSQTADSILLQVIRPVLEKNKAVIRCWFFIRYQDPEPHLRVRFQTNRPDASFLLEELHQLLIHQNHRELIREFQNDTYHREVERYSERLIKEVECFFSAGSDLVLEIIGRPDAADEVQLDMTAFQMTWSMCQVFLAELTEIKLFLEEQKNRFLQEFSGARNLSFDLDMKYRALASELRLALADTDLPEKGAPGMQNMLRKLKTLKLKTADRPAAGQTILLADLIHMQLNRLLPNRQREYEAMVYYILHKYAVSVIARNK